MSCNMVLRAMSSSSFLTASRFVSACAATNAASSANTRARTSPDPLPSAVLAGDAASAALGELLAAAACKDVCVVCIGKLVGLHSKTFLGRRKTSTYKQESPQTRVRGRLSKRAVSLRTFSARPLRLSALRTALEGVSPPAQAVPGHAQRCVIAAADGTSRGAIMRGPETLCPNANDVLAALMTLQMLDCCPSNGSMPGTAGAEGPRPRARPPSSLQRRGPWASGPADLSSPRAPPMKELSQRRHAPERPHVQVQFPRCHHPARHRCCQQSGKQTMIA